MPDRRRKRCVVCGRHTNEVGPLSWTGKCVECWPAILEDNILGIASGTGPAHRRRLRGYAKWLERAMLDEARAEP